MPPSYPSTDYSLRSLHSLVRLHLPHSLLSQVHYGRGSAEREWSGLDESPNPNLLPVVYYRSWSFGWAGYSCARVPRRRKVAAQ